MDVDLLLFLIAFADINVFPFFYTDEEDLCSNCPGDTALDHE